jgi:hypothetical protein
MKSFILRRVLWVAIMMDLLMIQDNYRIVPAEWIWIALAFYALGALHGSRMPSIVRPGRFATVGILGMALACLYGAFSIHPPTVPANFELGQFAIRILALLVFNVFLIVLMAIIYWLWDRWERAHAARADAAERSGE